MCSIPTIFNDFEKDVERNLFDVNFLFNYYIKLCRERLGCLIIKKIVLNASRVSTSLVVGTGTFVSTGGIYEYLKVFGTMNSLKSLISEEKNSQFLMNFRIKRGNNLTRLFKFL